VADPDDIDAKVREAARRLCSTWPGDTIHAKNVQPWEGEPCHCGPCMAYEEILRDLAAAVERATERKALLAAADEIRRYATTWADDATGRYGSGRRSGFRLAEERVRRMALLPLPAPSHDPVSRVAGILDSREQEMTPEQRETARAAVRDIASKLPSHEGAEPKTPEERFLDIIEDKLATMSPEEAERRVEAALAASRARRLSKREPPAGGAE
jgi:hypothetical protein